MEKQTFASYKKHNNWLTIVAFVIFLALFALILWSTVETYRHYLGKPLVQTFTIMVAIAFGICGYSQIIGVSCNIISFIKKKTVYIPYDAIVQTTIISNTDKVAILYVTKDDFIPNAFATALDQIYANVDVYVLDDSTNPDFINKIKEFKHNSPKNFTILRREGKGSKNKAGNLNNFLEQYRSQYDYIAVMDSDTYVQPNFISDSLKYFHTFSDVGMVQTANNAITNVNNVFQDVCTPNYSKKREFWSLDGAIVNEYLVTFCTGHSLVISLKALDSIGGRFPDCISEDWSSCVDLKNKGWWTTYAPNILSWEETPPNYVAWKKRQMRWEAGAFQFFGQYGWKIFKGKYRPSEKLYHIYASTLIWSTPLMSYVLGIFTYIQLYQFTPEEAWANPVVLVPFIVSMLLIGLSTTCAISKPAIVKANFWQTLKSMFFNGFVVMSVMPSAFVKFFALFFTKKKFAVTIKENQKFKWYDTFKYNWFDILFWTAYFAFIIATVAITKHWAFIINPFVWLTFVSYISLFFFPVMSNKAYTPKI